MEKGVRNIAICIPCYNDGFRLNLFLPQLLEELNSLTKANLINNAYIVIVDDASSVYPAVWDNLANDFNNIELVLLKHFINLGQGAALQTAVSFVRRELPDMNYYITMDADGQHMPSDIRKFIDTITSTQVDIVFGNRFSKDSDSNVPFLRKILLKLALGFESWLTGIDLSDAHNGFRCFTSSFANKLNLKQNRMAHATEFKQIVNRGQFKYSEVPVTIKYSPDSLAKGQSGLNGVNILRDLLRMYIFDKGL